MTTSISTTAHADAVIRLRAAGCVFAEEEAAVLAEAAPDDATLAALVGRRALGEPLEQVVGHADFCGVRVQLRPGVFVPRVRSELLVRLAVEAAARHPSPDVLLDLCCGSGALGLAVHHQVPALRLHAADLDPTAVGCARDNFTAWSRSRSPGPRNEQGQVHEGDLFDALPDDLRGRVTVLLANVPYVATHHIPLLPSEARDHEPRLALDGGPDGLDVFRRVAADAAGWLAPGGVLLSEVTEAQAAEAQAVTTRAGLIADLVHDEDLEARVIRGRSAMR